MEIEKNHVVSIDYTVKDEQGNVIDTSEGRSPLSFIHGLGMIIPGLENELSGKKKGEKLEVKIPPDQAYGQRNEQMVQTVPRSDFQEPEKLQPGMQFQVETQQGPMILTIKDVQEQEVVVDGNHPLAGTTLNFDVEVVEVRKATDEEISHGHVHGEGGHEH